MAEAVFCVRKMKKRALTSSSTKWGQKHENGVYACVCLFVAGDYHRNVNVPQNGTQLREPFKTVRHYLLFSYSLHTKHSLTRTHSDIIYIKLLWFFDNSCNNPSAVCLCSLYLRMVSMGSLQNFNTNFWLMVLILLLPLTSTLSHSWLQRGSQEIYTQFCVINTPFQPNSISNLNRLKKGRHFLHIS